MNALLLSVVLPFLSIEGSVQDNAVAWTAVVPPTTNYFPAEVRGTNFWLQVGILNGQWLTVEPKLDAFPDRWTTNFFFAVPPVGTNFFRIVNDPAVQTNAVSPTVFIGPRKQYPTSALLSFAPPPMPTNGVVSSNQP